MILNNCHKADVTLKTFKLYSTYIQLYKPRRVNRKQTIRLQQQESQK